MTAAFNEYIDELRQTHDFDIIGGVPKAVETSPQSLKNYHKWGDRHLKIWKFQIQNRPYYLSAGGLIGFVAALGIVLRKRPISKVQRLEAMRRSRVRVAAALRKIGLPKIVVNAARPKKRKFKKEYVVTPDMYDQTAIEALIKQLNRAVTKAQQVYVMKELQEKILGIYYSSYIVQGFREYKYFYISGENIIFTDNPQSS